MAGNCSTSRSPDASPTEAAVKGIALHRVVVRVNGDFAGDPAVSTPITYNVELSGDASEERLRELVSHVDRIAEIPNSLRLGTDVRLGEAHVTSLPARS